MRFGILLDHQYERDDDLQARLPELIDFVESVRDLGFDSLFGIHHYLSTLRTFQPLSLLARLVPHTGNMQLGTGILILPLLHPVHHAEEIASIDQLCGGRLVLGVGAGYRENEFRAFGIDRSERLGRMWECIEILRKLWQGEPVSYEGRYYKLDGDEVSVLPVQRPHPPIWVGSGAPKVIGRIAREGLPWLTAGNAKRNWALGNLADYRAELRKSGFSEEGHEFPMHRDLCIADSEEEAYHLVEEYIRCAYLEYAPFGMEWMQTKFADVTRKAGIFGSPEQVVEKIRGYAEAGYNHFVFRVQWLGCPREISLRTLERFSAEVAPILRASAPTPKQAA